MIIFFAINVKKRCKLQLQYLNIKLIYLMIVNQIVIKFIQKFQRYIYNNFLNLKKSLKNLKWLLKKDKEKLYLVYYLILGGDCFNWSSDIVHGCVVK